MAAVIIITDKFWSTGISAQDTTRTKPEYWPGINMLGKTMADMMSWLDNEKYTIIIVI